jgi:hypothetical protein
VDAIARARRRHTQILVPDVVAGEAFTKLRYDRRISGRGDARAALAVFDMLAADPGLFEIRGMPSEAYSRSLELLAGYVDQAFSYVDAIVLLIADDDRRADVVLTVDSSLAVYRFRHPVSIATPAN